MQDLLLSVNALGQRKLTKGGPLSEALEEFLNAVLLALDTPDPTRLFPTSLNVSFRLELLSPKGQQLVVIRCSNGSWTPLGTGGSS